jgi:multidrug resistance efflux pump
MDARTGLQAAEAEESQARRHWDETRREVEKARAAVDEAQRDLDRLHSD